MRSEILQRHTALFDGRLRRLVSLDHSQEWQKFSPTGPVLPDLPRHASKVQAAGGRDAAFAAQDVLRMFLRCQGLSLATRHQQLDRHVLSSDATRDLSFNNTVSPQVFHTAPLLPIEAAAASIAHLNSSLKMPNLPEHIGMYSPQAMPPHGLHQQSADQSRA